MTRMRVAAMSAVVALLSGAAVLSGPTPASGAAPSAACTPQWAIVPTENPGSKKSTFNSLDVRTPTDAWAVGGHFGGGFRTLTEHWNGTVWDTVQSPNVTNGDNYLNDVAAISANDVWAVGWAESETLAMHWDGSDWNVAPTPNPGAKRDTLVAVTAFASNNVWAAGFTQDSEGVHHTLIVHWNGSAWSVVASPDAPGQSSGLINISGTGPNDIWAVGYSSSPLGNRTLVEHWNGTAWTIVPSPSIANGHSVLSGVTAPSTANAWAVGYSITGPRHRSLIEHWNGTSWEVVPSPNVGRMTALRDVEWLSPTDVWAAGWRYDFDAGIYRSVTMRFDGSAWSLVAPAKSPAGGDNMIALDAVQSAGQLWAAGYAATSADSRNATTMIQTICPTAATATMEPVPSSFPAAAPGRTKTPAEAPVGPTPRRPAVDVVARDRAVQAGIAETALSYGGAVADINGDGWPDFFESHKEDTGRMYVNDHGVFAEIDAGFFSGIDRYNCAFADVDVDSLLDLMCMSGDERGTELHQNQLAIAQPGGTYVERTGDFNLGDPYARGRTLAFLDVNKDGFPDVFLHNLTLRPDGMPDPNRLMINVGGQYFVDAPQYGFDTNTFSEGCTRAADLDGDGWTDLAICTGHKNGLKLYRNVLGTSFSDVTSAMNAPTSGSIPDAIFDDFNGDGKPDLAYVTSQSVNVRLQQGGQFVDAFTMTGLAKAARLASGDANGDGRPDLYVVQGQQTSPNPPDVMLLNGGDGTSFTQMTVPQTTQGCGDHALAIDYNRNGLTDFVVLNGCHGNPGPVQLISFFPAP